MNLKGGLSTDNLLLICDGLGKSLDDYRPKEVPDWVIDRVARANDLTPEEAEQLAAERTQTARRQAAAARTVRRRDAAAILRT